MGGEFEIDRYLDWLFQDDYILNEDTQEWERVSYDEDEE